MGGIAQRDRLPRRVHPVRRDVPDVQRLHARLGAAAALSGLHVIYVWTHDSVGLGEDGPTHQPVEHYAALRAIPNLWFVRPGDANETAAAWALAIERGQEDPWPGGAGADPPEAADARGHGRAGARGRRAAAATSCATRRGRQGAARSSSSATGSELQLAFGAAEALERDGHRGPGRVAPLLGAVRAPGRGLSRVRPAARGPRAGSRSRPACRSAGIAGSATRARSSASTTSARRRRPARSSRSSGSRVDRVVAVARGVLAGDGPRPASPTLEPGHLPAPAAWRAGGHGVPTAHPSLDGEPGVGRTASPIPATAEAEPRCASPSPPITPGPPSRTSSSGASPRPASATSSIDLGGDGSDPHRRLPGLRRPPRPRGSRPARPIAGVLICGSGVGASVAANKIRRHPERRLPRHLLGPPGRRARRHERPDPGLAGDRPGTGLGMRRRVPGGPVQRRGPPPAPARQGPRDRGAATLR